MKIPTFEEYIFESLWEAEDDDKKSTDRSPIDSEVKEVLENFTFRPCTLYNASLFENQYDVLKFDVRYPTKGGAFLHKCNTALRELPYQNDYPDYHPHMTIAYLKKGTGKKYCNLLENKEYSLLPAYAVYSQPDGTKTKMKIKK